MLHETSRQAMLHRDIKPDNFLMGLKSSSGTVYVVDFGLAKCYLDKDEPDGHIEFSGDKPIIGTARFASVNAHHGNELSRRDDLESLGYMMIYFLIGSLPWSAIERRTIEETFYAIAKVKGEIKTKELCHGCPQEFILYMDYCKGLTFKQRPDYGFLRVLMQGLARREHLELDINCFDWCFLLNRQISAPG